MSPERLIGYIILRCTHRMDLDCYEGVTVYVYLTSDRRSPGVCCFESVVLKARASLYGGLQTRPCEIPGSCYLAVVRHIRFRIVNVQESNYIGAILFLAGFSHWLFLQRETFLVMSILLGAKEIVTCLRKLIYPGFANV